MTIRILYLAFCLATPQIVSAAGSLTATLGNLNGTNGCNGPQNLGVDFGGGVGRSYWLIRTSTNTAVNGSFTFYTPPGVSLTCTLVLRYATITDSQWCGDASWTTVTLGTISGAVVKTVLFSVPITTTGRTCLQGHFDGPNTGPLGGGIFTAFWGGPSIFSKSITGTDGSTGALYVGNIDRNTSGDDRTFWITPVALSAVGPICSVNVAPGSGVTWPCKVAYSNGPPSSTQNCADMSLTVTSAAGNITGTTQKSTDGPISVSVLAGSCIQIQSIATGGTPAALSGCGNAFGNGCTAFGLEVTPATTGPIINFMDAGSGGNGGHQFSVGHFAISDQAGNTPEYWFAPPSGLVSCGGAFTFGAAVGGGTFGVGLTASTAAPTSAQSTADLSYTSTAALVTCVAGTKSCIFPMTQFYVPPNGVFALNVTSESGSPVMTGAFNWQGACRPQLSAGMSGGMSF